MALGLHADCKSKMRASLESALHSLNVERGMLLTGRSSSNLSQIDEILPTQGKLRERLTAYVSEQPAYDFLGCVLSEELHATQKYDPDSQTVPLGGVSGYKDLAETADRLVCLFDSLPWTYTATFALPRAFSDIFRAVGSVCALRSGISIAFPDDDSFRDYEPPENDTGLSTSGNLANHLMAGTRRWEERRAYMQVRMIGFADKYSPTAPVLEATALFRSLCGLGLALRLWKIQRSYHTAPSKALIYVHKLHEGQWSYRYSNELPSPVGAAVDGLVVDDLDGYVTTDSMKHHLEICAGNLVAAFSAGERSHRLLLAAQWHFDSHADSDELLSFVRAAVVAEILLGDKAASDTIGLTELLANRCAYLISRSHKEREELLAEFKKIYGIRSKIVHQGKTRLNAEEGYLLTRLRWMCMRMIQEECALLKRDAAP